VEGDGPALASGGDCRGWVGREDRGTAEADGAFTAPIEARMAGMNAGVPTPSAHPSFAGWKASFPGSLHANSKHATEFYREEEGPRLAVGQLDPPLVISPEAVVARGLQLSPPTYNASGFVRSVVRAARVWLLLFLLGLCPLVTLHAEATAFEASIPLVSAPPSLEEFLDGGVTAGVSCSALNISPKEVPLMARKGASRRSPTSAMTARISTSFLFAMMSAPRRFGPG
jgi:hypothetical protein